MLVGFFQGFSERVRAFFNDWFILNHSKTAVINDFGMDVGAIEIIITPFSGVF